MAKKSMKQFYELVPTEVPTHSDDEIEDNVFMESSMTPNMTVRISGTRRKVSPSSSNARNRLFGSALVCIILIMIVVVSGLAVRVIMSSTLSISNSLPSLTNTIVTTNTRTSFPHSITTTDHSMVDIKPSEFTTTLTHSFSHSSLFNQSHSVSRTMSTSNSDSSSTTASLFNHNTETSSQSATSAKPIDNDIINWHREILHSMTALSITVHDINNDGILDLVFDVTTERLELRKYLVCPNEENSCMEDFGFTPCRVRLVALDGRNGSLIWEKWIDFTPFAANCKHDLNLDGVLDCTFSGRQGSFAVLNPVDGSFLWYIDPAVTFPPYNYYYPLFIRDFDGDGVTDIIITHGGDAVYTDNDKIRSPGLIFVVSGKTGQQLSDRIVMPDGHETYSTPIGYNISGTIEVVLFGSGGETIGGSLWAITVESLQENVDTWAHNKPIKYDINYNYIGTRCLTDEHVRQIRPKFVKDTFKYVEDKDDWLLKCPVWNTGTQPLWNPYKLCVYEIITAGKTGTITSPVIIDYNNDGIKDLLVPQFNDHLMMMDGATTKITWDHYAEDTQSYSIPSPLYFNDDDIPDFLFQFNKGKWVNYDYSYFGILDGNNGELLWSLNCSMGAMGSAITIKSSIKGHDGILFLNSGCDNDELTIVKREPAEYQSLEHDVCPAAHWGIEKSMCMAEQRRSIRDIELGGDIVHIDDNVSGGDSSFPVGSNSKQIVRIPEPEIDASEFIDDIPVDIWTVRNETDFFPDPWSDTKSFFEDYCNVPYFEHIVKIYYLTPDMIKLGKVVPLIVNRPYVYRLPNDSRKRHSPLVDKLHVSFNNRKDVRCAHILVPQMISTTPTIGDFNNDGKLDVVISTTYNGYPNRWYSIRFLHPPKVSVDAFTIEDKLREVFGLDIRQIVDFTSYYPANRQPWGQYMGSRGNGVYETPTL